MPIYYESRLAKLDLPEAEKPRVDAEFEEATEVELRERLRTKWAAMEAIVGAEKRVGTIAKDLVKHFEERLEAMDGKAMVVCMSRRICVDLYNQIVKLRPSLHGDNNEAGVLKIVMTGSASDGPESERTIRSKWSAPTTTLLWKWCLRPIIRIVVEEPVLAPFGDQGEESSFAMTLEITTRYLARVAIVDCTGRIVLGDETWHMRQWVKKLLSDSPHVVLNLARVTHMDSVGVGMLVSLYTSACAAGSNIKLAGLGARVKNILQITKLGTIFEVFDTAENAAASFNELARGSSR